MTLIRFAFVSANGSAESFSNTLNTSVAIPFGAFITATMVDPEANTSEFSPCIALTEPAPLVVNKTADTNDGLCNTDCSLREAIVAANTQAGANRIHFNIPGSGVQSIAVTSALPSVTGQTLIDGYTQSGATPNSAGFPNNAQLRIELDGSATALGVQGLNLSGAHSVVRGLIVNRFQSILMSIDGDDSQIAGCFLGADATATQAFTTANGIVVFGQRAVIGGADLADGNLIAGGTLSGLALSSAGARVERNQIGSTTGTMLGNRIGIVVATDPFSNLVGAANTIGSKDSARANLIVGNQTGIHIGIQRLPATIRANRIEGNAALGIDLGLDPINNGPDGVTPNDKADADTGPNQLQNFPEISRALRQGSDVQITAHQERMANNLPVIFNLDFYVNASCNAAGHGEGSLHIGSTEMISRNSSSGTRVSLDFVLTGVNLPVGAVLTATATDPAGNTSEFSACASVVGDAIFANRFE